MNRNLAVSFATYTECVQAQVDFLVSQGGSVQVKEVTHRDVRECYDHSVSVDACALDLVR